MFDLWSATARRVADAALLDAARRRCAFVEPVHFLAALLREHDAGANRWLREEAQVAPALPPELEPHLRGLPTDKRYAKFSDSTEAVLRFVATQAAGRERRTCETMDLLYALSRQEGDPAMEFLKGAQVGSRRIELAMETGKWPDL
ncbi:MAG TPA: Clp protease N-terminal domain-containing protein [Planctomycetota bacterium]|nr:Clp protease N-terminal domain-containing protein [Planctomycetota bacterium]